MSLSVGVNAHPPKLVSPQQVTDLGAQLVRFPPWRTPKHAPWLAAGRFDFTPWIDAWQGQGTDVLLVLDDAVHGFKPARQSWPVFYRSLRARFPTVTNFQVLNEPDGQPGSASGPRSPAFVSARLADAREGLGDDVTLWAPGAGPAFLRKVDLGPVDVVCAHVYGLTPTRDWPYPATGFGDLEDYLADYQRFGKPVALDEIGGESGLFASEGQRAEWFSRTIRVAANWGVTAYLVYCLTRAQGGDLAILDANGDPLESYAAVFDAIGADL